MIHKSLETRELNRDLNIDEAEMFNSNSMQVSLKGDQMERSQQ